MLFNQLIAGGVIRGLKLLATSQFQQYDGLYRYFVKKPFDTHIFDKEKNPLGVTELTHSEELQSKAKILEYKFSLDALIHEFECGEKRPDDIQLAVCWEIGSEFRKDYTATSLLDLDHLNHREFHGITHLFASATSSFHVVCLKELIEYLNNVDGVQEYHKKQYGDDIIA